MGGNLPVEYIKNYRNDYGYKRFCNLRSCSDAGQQMAPYVVFVQIHV